jgi:formylglycine-generating enzyme required for sulfatase activity
MLGEKRIDRVELVSILPGTQSSLSFAGSNFYSATASETLIRTISEIPHGYSDGGYFVVGINQQTGRSYIEAWDGSSLLTTFGSTWQEGYYRIHIRYYEISSSAKTGRFINLEKYPLYWNRSQLAWMVYIQPGVYWEGSPAGEYGRASSGENLRRVTLTKGFYLARTQTTAGLYSTVVLGTASTSEAPRGSMCFSMFDDNGVFWKYESNNWVSYYTGDSAYSGLSKPSYFCVKSRGKSAADGTWGEYTAGLVDSMNANQNYQVEGFVWGLPTEAQWEYACRAGTKTALNNGKNLNLPTANESAQGGSDTLEQHNLDEIAWYNLNSKNSSGTATVRSVGLKKPNAWGLYDMLGNLYEWCSNYETRTSAAVTDPDDVAALSLRAFRGGACIYAARYARSASRSSGRVSGNATYYGCRLALLPTT